MIQIINDSHDPYFNLALEEYLLNKMEPEEEYFVLWRNQPAVVVGRHQNTYEEINAEAVKQKDIKVLRRLSGGGAVYHDLGNLNFTFIIKEPGLGAYDFRKFTRPVIRALARLGIKAEDNGRNDITIKGLKFSGNAQYRYHRRLLHHGTILFGSNFEDMMEVLQPRPGKMAIRGIKSVASRVTNVIDHLEQPMTIEEFYQIVVEEIWGERGFGAAHQLSSADRQQIEELRARKYSTWAWNYGYSPAYNYCKSARFNWGEIQFYLDIHKGRITGSKICGDFFPSGEIAELEQQLLQTPYNFEDIYQKLKQINVSGYLPELDELMLAELLVGKQISSGDKG